MGLATIKMPFLQAAGSAPNASFLGSAPGKGRSEEQTKRRRGRAQFTALAAQPSCCFKRAIKMNYD